MTLDPIEVVIPKNGSFAGSLDAGMRREVAAQFAIEIRDLASILGDSVGVRSNVRRVRLFNLPPEGGLEAFYVARSTLRHQPSGVLGTLAERSLAKQLEQNGKADSSLVNKTSLPADTLWLNSGAAFLLLAGLQAVGKVRFQDPLAELLTKLAAANTKKEFSVLVSMAYEHLLHELGHSLQGPIRFTTAIRQFTEALADSIALVNYYPAAYEWGIAPILPGRERFGQSSYAVNDEVLKHLLDQTRSQHTAPRRDQLARLMQDGGREGALVTLATDLVLSAKLEPDEPVVTSACRIILDILAAAVEVENEISKRERALLASDPTDREKGSMMARNAKLTTEHGRRLGGEAIRQIRGLESPAKQSTQTSNTGNRRNSSSVII